MDKFKLPSRAEAADRLSAVRSERKRLADQDKELEEEERDITFYLNALPNHNHADAAEAKIPPKRKPSHDAAKTRRGPRMKKGDAIARLAREVLLGADFMPIQMLVDEMKKRGWSFSDNYIRCRERVRNEMLRRPNVFMRPVRGMWSVAREQVSATKAEEKGGGEIA